MERGTTLALLAAFSFGAAAEAAAQAGQAPASQQVRITEWTVPYESSRPRDPDVDAQGRVWFVGQVGNYIAYLNPVDGQFRRFEIDSGTNPHNLIVGRDGAVWYAGNRNAMIGKLDPNTGEITRYRMPEGVRDPHTLVFDREGKHIWFTAQQAGYVGRLDMASGKVDVVRAAQENARPYGIWMDSQNRPWLNLFGTNKVAMVDPATMQMREYALADAQSRSRRIVVTGDDMVWYVDYTRGQVGRLNPNTGEVAEWPAPGGARSFPYAMTLDDQGMIWYVETGARPNTLIGFDPRTQKVFSSTPIAESGAGSVRHMIYHQPSRSIWFGTDANTIGQAVLR
jgi:virginiamycin B lyase